MAAHNDVDRTVPISRHLLFMSVTILLITLTIVSILMTLSFIEFLSASEDITQRQVSLKERTDRSLKKPLSLISEVVLGISIKTLEGAELISNTEADSLISISQKHLERDSKQLAVLFKAVLESDEFPSYRRNVMKAKMSEADAALGSIRTQLRVYYGENGVYPYSRDKTYVMGARWNDFRKGELTGNYFTDYSYTYYCPDGESYLITCAAGGVLESDRTLNNRGTLSGGFR